MDEDCDDFQHKVDRRAKILGFKPQKELAFNSLLPYAKELDEESTFLFEEIKCNLGKAVALREMRPGCAVWTSRLIKYIRLYGLKFSKEDHILLIKLMYELVLIPDLEPLKFSKFGTLFSWLTKRKYLLSPEELRLPWRPLYDLGTKMFYRDCNSIGMTTIPAAIENIFDSVVRGAKPYFPPEATSEILAVHRGNLSPWDHETKFIISNLLLFLPLDRPPEHLLWWNDMWLLWNTCYNTPAGCGKILIIFAGLAKHGVGAVDWTPYIPNLFSRFLRSFNLPVGPADEHVSRTHVLDTKSMAVWITWSITPDGIVLDHLQGLLLAIESYLHPANSGRWTLKLKEFIKKLTHEFLMRYFRESHPKFRHSWERQTPKQYRLRDCDVDAFVKCVSVPATIALHARTGAADACAALRDLATIRPAIVIPALLDRLRTSLDSLTEPHRVVAAFQAVAAVARPLLRGPDAGYPEGPTHVASLLLATLPAIDPNDPRKTFVALQFIYTFCTMVPLVDCSKVPIDEPDLTDEEVLALECTSHFEDFVLLFFDRLFLMVESSALEQTRPGSCELDSARSRLESTLENAMSATATVLLEQCEPRIFDLALNKFKKFVFETAFETNVAGSTIAHVLGSFSRVDPMKTYNAFLPQIAGDIIILIQSEDARKEAHPPRETMYKLLLLSQILNAHSKAILAYEEMITEVLEKALRMHSREAVELVCEGIYNILTSLGSRHSLEFRCSLHDYSKPWVSVREWGRSVSTSKARLRWAEPGLEELEASHRFLNRLVLGDLQKLESWALGNLDLHKERVWRALTVLHASLSCTSLMPSPNEEPVLLMDSKVPATSFILALGFRGPIKLDGRDVRNYITDVAHTVQTKLLETKSDETLTLKALVSLWERLASVWGGGAGGGRASRGSAHGVELRCRSINAANKLLCGRGGPIPGDGKIRSILMEATYLQHDMRVELSSDAGPGVSLVRVAHALLDLAAHPYAAVRAAAQPKLQWLCAQHAHSARALLPHFLQLFQPVEGLSEEEAHARHKGILYTLSGALTSKRDWEIARVLWPAILKAPLSEKPTIIKLENLIVETIRQDFTAVNVRLIIPDKCVENAMKIIPTAELKSPEFINDFNGAKEYEKQFWLKIEENYHELVDELVTIAEDPNTHWRRSILAGVMLGRTALEQTPWGPKASSFVAKGLIHSNVHVRRGAQKRTLYALKQTKKVRPITKLVFERRPIGYCKEIEWALLTEENRAMTDEQWNKPTFHNPKVGFFDWTYPLEVPAPPKEQWSSRRDPNELTDQERVLYDFFMSDEKLDKLFTYLSAEEKKGSDKFDIYRFALFKSLFRQFGLEMTLKFLNRCDVLAGDGQESHQRCAAEILSAALRAPKHWSREDAHSLYDVALPILRKGLMAASPETFMDWAICVGTAAENIDPNRHYRLYECLLECCVMGEEESGAAHNMAARLHALQGALASLSWRGAKFFTIVIEKLHANDYTAHPYQNVRMWVASIVATVLDLDLTFPGGEQGPLPTLNEFIKWAEFETAPLFDKDGDINVPLSSGPTRTAPSARANCQNECIDIQSVPQHPLVSTCLGKLEDDSDGLSDRFAAGVHVREPDRDCSPPITANSALTSDQTFCTTDSQSRAICVLSIYMRAISSAVAVSAGGARAEHYNALRVACSLHTRDRNDELASAATLYRADLSRAPHTPALLEHALKQIDAVFKSRSWRTRETCVRFAQTLAFHSLAIIRSNPTLAHSVENFTLTALHDVRAEVRSAAAKMLSGLMHCGALTNEDETLNKLIKECRSKNPTIRRHGTLGVCSYVASRPYTLAPNLGSALEALSNAGWSGDTREAIRTTQADFKRTHLDDWATHSAMLLPHELDLLAELAQPPDYCA